MSNFEIWVCIYIVLLVEFATKAQDDVLKAKHWCLSVQQETALAEQFSLALDLLVLLGELLHFWCVFEFI